MACSLLQSGCLSARGNGRPLRGAALVNPARALAATSGARPGAGRRARAALRVRANELNKWSDRDAREADTDPGLDDDGFERDTLKVLHRVVTARSVQRLILQLQETDVRMSSWLADFCSKHNPMEGDKFLQALLRAQPTTVEGIGGSNRKEISPSEIADRLIITRHSLAKSMAALPQYVASANLDVYRLHVEAAIPKEKPRYRRSGK